MFVALALGKIRLIEVVSEHRVERRHVPSHTGHEGREQTGERQNEEPRRTIFFHQRENDAIVVLFGNTVVKAGLNLIVGQSVHTFVRFVYFGYERPNQLYVLLAFITEYFTQKL